MQDIHTGFQNLNRVNDTEEFFRFLDAADGLESIQGYRRVMLDLCPPAPGQRILDVGCGVGHSPLRLAPLVGATGAVVGVDKSETLIAEARRRAATTAVPVTYQVGDARHLDFESRSFDLCRTERVLMYLDDPERALDEMFRVLRPNGMFAFFEFDYEGILVDAPDRTLTRRVARLVSDSVPSPWIGRQLPRLLRERGAQTMTVIPHMILTPFAMWSRVVSGTLAQAVETGEITSGELKTWWQSLERAESAGRFFSAFSGFLLCGRTPG
jgi:ubiquinone/menaquinone biosynthesis C-methylase UbiE